MSPLVHASLRIIAAALEMATTKLMQALWAPLRAAPISEWKMMPDDELLAVLQSILGLDPHGHRIGSVLRQTLDQLYDGQHTGRYRWDQLYKTEKTHCGTLVEINLHREFAFEDGQVMDYQIAKADVDCKYSQSVGGWMFPPESIGYLCLLISADDQHAKWSLGLIRVNETVLRNRRNRDAKRSMTALGRKKIQWLFNEAALPPNVLLQLPRETVDRIMKLRRGQGRIDEIFRVAQGKRIGRGVIATLGQQDDYMRRVRGNGGSRARLKREGIIILGDYEAHRAVAQGLGVSIPEAGEFVSIRVAPACVASSGVVRLDGRLWKVATTSDAITTAPYCPHC